MSHVQGDGPVAIIGTGKTAATLGLFSYDPVTEPV